MQTARTRLQVDERRQQLVEIGLELFGHQTYDELSIDEIAKRAAISKGLLYHYFPSKRAFYVAALTEAARQLIEETDFEQPPEQAQPDLSAVRDGIRAFLEYVVRRQRAYTFLLRGGVGTDAEVGDIVEGTRQALLDRTVARMSRFGAPADDPATRLRLRGWLGFIEGATLDWVEKKELTIDEFCNLLVQMAAPVLATVINPPKS